MPRSPAHLTRRSLLTAQPLGSPSAPPERVAAQAHATKAVRRRDFLAQAGALSAGAALMAVGLRPDVARAAFESLPGPSAPATVIRLPAETRRLLRETFEALVESGRNSLPKNDRFAESWIERVGARYAQGTAELRDRVDNTVAAWAAMADDAGWDRAGGRAERLELLREAALDPPRSGTAITIVSCLGLGVAVPEIDTRPIMEF